MTERAALTIPNDRQTPRQKFAQILLDAFLQEPSAYAYDPHARRWYCCDLETGIWYEANSSACRLIDTLAEGVLNELAQSNPSFVRQVGRYYNFNMMKDTLKRAQRFRTIKGIALTSRQQQWEQSRKPDHGNWAKYIKQLKSGEYRFQHIPELRNKIETELAGTRGLLIEASSREVDVLFGRRTISKFSGESREYLFEIWFPDNVLRVDCWRGQVHATFHHVGLDETIRFLTWAVHSFK